MYFTYAVFAKKIVISGNVIAIAWLLRYVGTRYSYDLQKNSKKFLLKKFSYFSKVWLLLIQYLPIFLGANLRSGEIGIFPIAHVVDVEYNDFDPDNTRRDDKKERYLLDYIGKYYFVLFWDNVLNSGLISDHFRLTVLFNCYLLIDWFSLNFLIGSVETSLYKGNIVLCQAVRKISLQQPLCQPICTVLEISDKGIKMLDKSETVRFFKILPKIVGPRATGSCAKLIVIWNWM